MNLSRLTLGLLITTFFLQPELFAKDKQLPSEMTGFFENSKNDQITQLIDQAKTNLDIEIYEMDDPKVIAAIRKAIKRGVLVRIVKEPSPVGASCRVFETQNTNSPSLEINRSLTAASCADQQKLVTEVNTSGGKYVPFTKPELCGGNETKTCLEHGKVIVVDSKFALISSGNFNTTNLCDLEYSPRKCNRDYSYVTDNSDLVKTLEAVIEMDLIGQKYDVSSVMKSGAIEKLTIGPDSLSPLVNFIQSAKKTILVENQYLKEPTLNAALIMASKRGVRVQIMVASVCSFGRPQNNEVKRLTSIFKSFDNAGIEIKMFNKNITINGKSGYLHAKAIVVDGNRAWMGSVNGSTQALTLNREFGIFFDDLIDVEKLKSTMVEDFTHPKAETWQDSLICAENEFI